MSLPHRKTEFVAQAMRRDQWFDFWQTAGGLRGVRKFASESGIKSPTRYALDMRAYLFRNPGDERKFELLSSLRVIRTNLEQKIYK